MAKARKDNKGRALLKGESQRTQDNRYVYTYTNPDGKRKYLYATTLQELRDDIIRKNPSDRVVSEVKKQRQREHKKDRALTLEAQISLMDYITDHPLYDYWRPLFTVLLGTGCRIGEVCGCSGGKMWIWRIV